MQFHKIRQQIFKIIKTVCQSPLKRIYEIDSVKRKQKNKIKNLNSEEVKQYLTNYSSYDNEKIFSDFKSSINGLTQEDVLSKQEQFGINEINFTKPRTWWKHLWQCYCNPFNLLLTALAAFQVCTKDNIGASIIGIMVVIATLMRFYQENRSKIAMDKLKIMVSNTVHVIRQQCLNESSNINNGYTKQYESREIPLTDLVPGDLVTLSAGDMIPADLRILSAKDLFISQSVLTGESLPVEKFSHINNGQNSNILNLNNIAFMGSNVISGSAKGIVLSTGNRTYFGNMVQNLSEVNVAPTQFQKGINSISLLLIKFMFLMVPIVLIINGFTKGNWIDATLFALSIAVGLTPEMLPMVVTSTLAKGANFMAKKKVIVKKLEALQNFGAMDILCTDKTGTLTQDKIVLEKHVDVYGKEYDQVLDYAYMNSFYQTGLKNLLDVAVLEHVEINKKLDITHKYTKIDEIPFDFTRKRMSVVVKKGNDHNLLICKGALEEILSICNVVQKNGKDIPLTKDVLKNIMNTANNLNKEGLRVVAVAIKKEPINKIDYSVKDEKELTLIGYIAFLDPPKESTRKALEALHNYGIEVKILTGDNELVTRKVCKDVEFKIRNVLNGDQISKMSDKELSDVVENVNVFVKLTPDHKERIVNILKLKNHTVGFMGDGINDAPALKVADVGISVDTAVDIAKEAADLILLEKSLMVLEKGVKEGRKTFANMLKYIRMAASSNFGNVFSVLIASAFIPFLPILPVQILIQNLLYDTSQTVIPFDNVDEEILKKPQKWNPDGLLRFMIFFGPISSIFDIITFLVIWFIFKANTAELSSTFQTAWFLEGLISQILIVHAIRTSKIPFINSIASPSVLIMTLFIIIVGVVIPISPIGEGLGFVSVPYSFYIFLFLIITGYMLLTQSVKSFYVKRYGWS